MAGKKDKGSGTSDRQGGISKAKESAARGASDRASDKPSDRKGAERTESQSRRPDEASGRKGGRD